MKVPDLWRVISNASVSACNVTKHQHVCMLVEPSEWEKCSTRTCVCCLV